MNDHDSDTNNTSLISRVSLQHYGLWHLPAKINPNRFIHKSLSCWAENDAVGCPFACRFCYVPDTSTKKLAQPLAGLGVEDPDADWGRYAFLRAWDEKAFLRSLKAAEDTPLDQLNADGNRAVIMSSTTDPFPIFAGPDPSKNRELNHQSQEMRWRSLELIRDRSTINVRILTRSPPARQFFDLTKTLGDRLVFGMSLPTLDNELAQIYEPRAPAPSQRLATLRAAKDAGLHVYVAMAPTYPECEEEDLRRTLLEIKALEPLTIFHEPINIRAENVERIAAHAQSIGRSVRTEVFATRLAWRRYAINALRTVERLATELGLLDRLHLWPDQDLASKHGYLALLAERDLKSNVAVADFLRLKEAHQKQCEEHQAWLEHWWNRISEWPGQPNGRRLLAA